MNLTQTISLTQSYMYFIQMLVLILQTIYVLFAFMLTRQIKLMNRNFQTPLAPLFSLLALIHFLVSLSVLAISVISF